MDAFQRQTNVELPCSVKKHFCRRIKHHYFVLDLILKYKTLKQLTQLIEGILFIKFNTQEKTTDSHFWIF